MRQPFSIKTLAVLAVAAAVVIAPARAQDAASKNPFRRLAPGVETTIPILRDADETVSRHDVVDLLSGIPDLAWKPNYLAETQTLAAMAKDVPFRRTIWNLEFTFKPLRMIEVDVPQATGKMERKLIWYMVYRVKNNGAQLRPKQREADETVTLGAEIGAAQTTIPKGTFAVELTDKVVLPIDPTATEREAIKFFPLFVLEAHKLATPKAYVDHLIPVAVPEIQRREDSKRKLLNSVQMAQTTIPLSTDRVDRSVWGVVTWEDIDPRTDFLSVYVQGLTNAYKWEDTPAAIQPGSPPATGRKFLQRTLKLNFWRPGDEFEENEREIHYGVPGEVDYEWVWRP
ncbi:MAG: hypothetical protein WD875_10820 [Pirellulales bacterium]